MLKNYAGVNIYLRNKPVRGTIFGINDTLTSNIRPYLKKTWLSDRTGVCSADVLVFRASRVEPVFLNLLLMSERFVTWTMAGAKGSKMPRGDKEFIMEMPVFCPSPKEQELIISYSQILDSLIAAAERQQELLKLQKLAYLQRMFPRNGEKKPRLRFPGFTGDWECQKIGEIIKTYPRTHYLAANIRSEGQFPVIQQGNTPIAGYTDGNPFNEYQQIVLFGDHTLSLYKPLSPFFIATDGVQIIGSDKVSASILYYLLKRYMPTDKGYKRHYSELKHTCCCFPPTNREQEQIGVFFEYLDSLITAAADRINTFLLLKRGYMQKMFI